MWDADLIPKKEPAITQKRAGSRVCWTREQRDQSEKWDRNQISRLFTGDFSKSKVGNLWLDIFHTKMTFAFGIKPQSQSPHLVYIQKKSRCRANSLAPGSLPVSIFPSCAAGPSGMTLFTWRNSSGSSPPMIVNPKPMLLFLRVVLRNVPFSWDASRVKSGFSTSANTS